VGQAHPDPIAAAWIGDRYTAARLGPPVQHRTERRHHEQEQVAAGFADLRRAVLNIAEAVRRSLVGEQPDSRLVQDIVERLQAASNGRSLEHMQQKVRRAADELVVLSTQRDRRQQELVERVDALSLQIKDLATELHQTRQASETDALTALLNRAGFDTAVRARTGASRLDRPAAQSGADRPGRLEMGQ